ncbi:MAG: serine/threonine-protein kinase [Candidatus Eiseniibacteriota bacterium]
MRSDEEEVERLADAIAEGRAVPDASGFGEGSRSAVVANLIALSRLSEFHRGPGGAAAAGSVAGAASMGPDAAAAQPASWGELRILEKVGEGAFGDVYRAWDPALNRPAALKLLRDDGSSGAAERILEEARLLAQVDHPGVARVYGAATRDGRPGIWMEFVEGSGLDAVLRREGPLPPREVARIGRELCAALDAVHARDLVHGDVKAQNVSKRADGRVVLVDFGAGSRGRGSGGERAALTPLYAPPEALSGGTAPSPRDDVYSLGVLLFHLATGRFPVEGDTRHALLEAHAAGRRLSLRGARADFPPRLAATIERAVSPMSVARFATARELGGALVRATARPVRLVAAAGVAAVAVAVAFVLLRGEATPPPALVADARWLRASAWEPLVSGDPVRVGDVLHLRLDPARDCHVYVLNADDRGALALLFPLPGLTLSNPVSAGREVDLPGSFAGRAEPLGWVVGTEGGTERFLVVAAEAPLREFERALERLPRPAPGALAVPLPPGSGVDLYRGITSLARLPAPAESHPGDDVFATARMLADAAPGRIWLHELTLRHAAR